MANTPGTNLGECKSQGGNEEESGWSDRRSLGKNEKELEAEAVAYLVASGARARHGLGNLPEALCSTCGQRGDGSSELLDMIGGQIEIFESPTHLLTRERLQGFSSNVAGLDDVAVVGQAIEQRSPCRRRGESCARRPMPSKAFATAPTRTQSGISPAAISRTLRALAVRALPVPGTVRGAAIGVGCAAPVGVLAAMVASAFAASVSRESGVCHPLCR
jgi:hypothetical protein